MGTMLFSTAGPFRPGVTTQAQADELNRMRTVLAALEKIGAVPPATVTRGPSGQPIVGVLGGGAGGGSFWAEITGSGGGPIAFSWKKKELTPAGTYADVDPAVTGEENAYAGAVVRMWPSPTKADAFEFAPVNSIGKLDGALSFGGSATMSVWAWDGSAYADTGENLTVYDWLLSSGQTVASGTQVTASYDARSGRWFVTGAQCS